MLRKVTGTSHTGRYTTQIMYGTCSFLVVYKTKKLRRYFECRHHDDIQNIPLLVIFVSATRGICVTLKSEITRLTVSHLQNHVFGIVQDRLNLLRFGTLYRITAKTVVLRSFSALQSADLMRHTRLIHDACTIPCYTGIVEGSVP